MKTNLLNYKEKMGNLVKFSQELSAMFKLLALFGLSTQKTIFSCMVSVLMGGNMEPPVLMVKKIPVMRE